MFETFYRKSGFCTLDQPDKPHLLQERLHSNFRAIFLTCSTPECSGTLNGWAKNGKFDLVYLPLLNCYFSSYLGWNFVSLTKGKGQWYDKRTNQCTYRGWWSINSNVINIQTLWKLIGITGWTLKKSFDKCLLRKRMKTWVLWFSFSSSIGLPQCAGKRSNSLPCESSSLKSEICEERILL